MREEPVVPEEALFHTMDTHLSDPETRKRVRTFEGTGTYLLPVPGAREVTAVWVRGTAQPKEVVNLLPMDPDGKILKEHRHPGFKLDKLPDGTPVLLRSKQLNDGIWQETAIEVEGDWDDQVPEPPPVPKEKRGPKPGGQVITSSRSGKP